MTLKKKNFQSEYIASKIRDALDMTEDEPVTVSQFLNLRDIMITVMAITSLRRLMKFAEFRLFEVAEKEERLDRETKQFQCWVIRISRHKTAAQGPSLIFLSETESKAFDAYLKYYRPALSLTVMFSETDTQRVRNPVVQKMSYSSLSKAVSKTGTKKN